jgi:hypothetical protein
VLFAWRPHAGHAGLSGHTAGLNGQEPNPFLLRRAPRNMTSERRLAANRKNAKRSTGPRTARGKLRVRSNAVQHGLTTTALRHPALAMDIQRMAKAICAESKNRLQFDQALSIAESELMLTKVRSTRFGALQFLSSIAPAGNDPVAASSEAQAHAVMDAAAQDEVTGAMQDGPAAFQRVLAEMTRYSRYERRALSRRQRAIRTFVATSILGRPPPQFRRASRSAAATTKPKR